MGTKSMITNIKIFKLGTVDPKELEVVVGNATFCSDTELSDFLFAMGVGIEDIRSFLSFKKKKIYGDNFYRFVENKV